VATNLYRNEALVQIEEYETDAAQADRLIDRVRAKWSALRELGYAGDYPVQVLRSGREDGSASVRVTEVFRWRSRQAAMEARASGRYQGIVQEIDGLCTTSVVKDNLTEVVRGFNANFPGVGGVELLKGVCSCLLTVDGVVENYPMSVKNGIVLMHRSPRMDLDGDGRNEMYLKILMHGGEIVQGALGPIRVEQNFNQPNDGIVKSNEAGGNDFPGTAIWRVAWRIHTPLGTVLTDPNTPLIFGPAAVQHYPPVGTHFHSPTGPVALVLETTGERIGTLVPGELTAFDIVVTKDDEIFADILNTPPSDIFSILDEWVTRSREATPVA